MCANYKPPSTRDAIAWDFATESRIPVGHEVFPGQAGWVITSQRPTVAVPACFGLVPHWAEPKLARHTYNARSETVATKPSFRNAWRKGQLAIVPAIAWFEPCYESGKAVRWQITRQDSEVFGMAAIWEYRMDDPGVTRLSMSLLTINATGHPIMDRMHGPEDEKRSVVVLQQDDWPIWLHAQTEADRRSLLQLFDPDDYTATPAPRTQKE